MAEKEVEEGGAEGLPRAQSGSPRESYTPFPPLRLSGVVGEEVEKQRGTDMKPSPRTEWS